MEACDISLVKEENIELIKTEPQNEDEFNMCGLSGIKTEDETDTSNSVDEIVKTEIKLYDSSLGIMDSNIDHFSPMDNSEEDIVMHMEEEEDVKQKIVQTGLRQEEIVLNMEEEDVKLKIVIRGLRWVDNVMHMVEEGNVKLKIVSRLVRKFGKIKMAFRKAYLPGRNSTWGCGDSLWQDYPTRVENR
uniref:Uncharacterized protein n=1 Tax=Timema tahoe TaxID=61484 RepID=A0A7R9IKT0_9NEOP|nr:unnamed protein product [Timema tahoe]